MRQIVMDTETTGLEPEQGHRIIEIGCVEMADRRLTGNNFHQYLQPDREIDAAAIEIHGITNDFLADKPRFVDVRDDLLAYIEGAELIIHNAAFDVGFIEHELRQLDPQAPPLSDLCRITDSLAIAKRLHPGQRNNLDALCKRYGIDNTHRELHGALLDAKILADVYLAMTGGQTSLSLDSSGDSALADATGVRRLPSGRRPVPVIVATDEELKAHEARLDAIAKSSGAPAMWQR
jgi:DNA polymerase-3 subunit epsilon